MANIPPEIEAVLRDDQVPNKIRVFIQGIVPIDPHELPARSRGPVATVINEINDELAKLAATGKSLIGTERTRLVTSTLVKEVKEWETSLKSAFVLKPSPFEILMQKHILIGSGSYQREAAKSRELFEDLIVQIDEGELGAEMSEDGMAKAKDALQRAIKVVDTIETSVKSPELRKNRDKTVNGVLGGEVHKLMADWNRAWRDDWVSWYRFWCL